LELILIFLILIFQRSKATKGRRDLVLLAVAG
jgi:hypothetical protein